MWDFTTAPVKETVERHYNAGKLLSSVCHGPAGFVKPVDKKGEPIVKGKKVRARQCLRHLSYI
jgi:putative intracellular protease/amidase